MIDQNVPQTKQAYGPSRRRAVFFLTGIVFVAILSGVVLQLLKHKILTGYDLSNSGLMNPNGKISITAIAIDANGQPWIGSPDGVFTLTPDGTWNSYTTSNSKLPSGTIAALITDSHNRVWVGTTSGLGMLTPEGVWETLLNERVFALAIDQQGNLWVATDKKISLLSNGQWTDYTSEDSGLAIPPYAFVIDQDKQLWTTDRIHIDLLTPSGNWIRDIAKGVIKPRYNGIRALAIDNQNRVWVGTENGLAECVSQQCSWYYPNLPNDLGSAFSYDTHILAFDRANRLWGSTGDAIYILNVFLAFLFQWLAPLQWLENLLLFVLAYIYVVHQLPKKNSALIGALGGGLVYIMLGVSVRPPILPNIFFSLLFSSYLPIGIGVIISVITIGLVISIVVSAVTGFIGGKIGGEIAAYIGGGIGTVALSAVLLLLAALLFSQ